MQPIERYVSEQTLRRKIWEDNMTPSSDETPRILPELSVVRLANAVESADGVIPKGSTGTVVARYAGGRGYEIEFTRPFHTVATVDVSDLA